MYLTLSIVVAALLVAALIVIAVVVSRLVKLTASNASLQGEKAALEDKLRLQEEAGKAIAREREKLFESQRKQMEESFKALSEQNSAGLRRQSAESIGELLKPIQEKFDKFDKTIQENQISASKSSATLEKAIKDVMDRSNAVGAEARNLANALTGRSKLQGDFGEMLLVDLLKNSGLEEGVHFFTQSVITDNLGHEVKSDSGATMIPDVIVNYPDGGQVIIDSKVSLSAFVGYCNSEDADDRRRYAKEHIDSIKNHINELKTKDYASYIAEGRKKVDYNIMFIPMENAFRLMLDQAPTLWQAAKDSKVLIVSQQTLMIVLNMILMSWKQYDQDRNIAQVYKTAEELMSQLKNWMDSFVSVGDNLQKAVRAYDDSKKKLTESNQSVVKKIGKLEQLKLSPKRSSGKIREGGRTVAGQESIIPAELAQGLDVEEIENK